MKKVGVLLIIISHLTYGLVFGQTTVVKGLKYNLDETALTATVGLAEDVNESVTFPKEIVHEGKTYQVTGIVRDKEDAEKHFTQLKSVEIEDGIASIGESAFAYCTSLEKAELPNSIGQMGEKAFYECTRLKSIFIPDKIVNICKRCFYGCTSLSDVHLPDSLDLIDMYAFDSCVNLTTIVFPESLTKNYAYSFRNTGLKSVYIPANVTSTGHSFIGCKNLESIIVDHNNPIYDSRDDCNSIIDKRNNCLMAGCKRSKIPEGVKSIYSQAFNDVLTDTKYIVPASVGETPGDSTLAIPQSLETIRGFYNCPELASVTIPKTVKEVGGFARCKKLQSITFEGKTDIVSPLLPQQNEIDFEDTGIKKMTVTGSISTGAMCYNSCIEEVVFSDSVTEVSYGCLQFMSNLKIVVLGKNISKIGNAFIMESPVKNIYCKNPYPIDITSLAFYGIDKSACTLYVPTAESKKLYQKAAEWKEFLNIEIDPSLDPNGIQEITNKTAKPEGIYNLQGQKQDQL